VEEFGIETFPQYLKGNSVLLMEGNVRTEYTGLIPWVPSSIPFVPAIGALVDTELLMRKIDRLAATVNLEKPWETPNAEYYDSISFKNWLEKNAWTSISKQLINCVK
jgi:monoamine oxidase